MAPRKRATAEIETKAPTAAQKRADARRAREDRALERRGTPRRKDGPRRHVDGSANWLKLQDADHDKWKYIYADMNSSSGQDHYADIGYKAVMSSKGGPRPKGMRVAAKVGDPIIVKGHILMRIAREDHEEIEEYGEDGQRGQAWADILERKIRSGEGVDSRRGLVSNLGLGDDLRVERHDET